MKLRPSGIGIFCLGAFIATVLFATELNAQETEGTVDLGGPEIFYRTYGMGPPLLLLHGFTSTGELWSDFLPELSQSYRLIVPDMRGHGRSTNPSERFIHAESASDILALLDHLGIDKVQAVGHSSGALTLLHAATREPSTFRSLVLLGAPVNIPESVRDFLRGISFEGYPTHVRENLLRWHPGGENQIRRLISQIHQFADDARDDVNFTASQLGSITAETLIIHGDRDVHPIEVAVETYRAIPNAYLWAVPNGNHALVFEAWDGTFAGSESFLPVLQDFLSGDWATR